MSELDEMMGFLITTGQVDNTFGLKNDSSDDDEEDSE